MEFWGLFMKGYQLLWVGIMGAVCMSQTYTKLSEDRAELLVKHLDLLRELKTTIVDKYDAHVAHANKSKLDAPTDVHKKISCLKTIIDKEWGSFVRKNKKFVDSIIEREREYVDDYYVFYHAQRKELRILQDFLREIYEYFQVTQSLKSFHFLRFWKDMPISVDANTFIDDNNKKGSWNDLSGGMNNLLLSVNLSLFGNCTAISGMCCTFDYFMKSYSMSYIDIKGILNEVFNTFEFDKKYIDQLIALNKICETKEGILFQFFIPKKLVDHCAYLSRVAGIPYDTAVPGCDFDQLKKRHLSISKTLDVYRKGDALIDAYKKDPAKNYVQDPVTIAHTVDQMQGRLIFSRDMLLNPTSGIKIYRYTTVSDKAMANYNEQLKKIAHQIFVDWLQTQHACDNVQGTKLESLVRNIQES